MVEKADGMTNCPQRYLINNEVIIISGVQRCGKPVLVQQIRELQGIQDISII